MTPPLLRLLPAFLRERLETREYLRNVLGNMGWLFAERIVRMGVTLVVGVWVARYLGPEKFGSLNYAFAFVLLFSAVSSMGLESVAIRDLAGAPSRRNEILGTGFALKVAGGAVALALTLVAVFLIRKEDPLTQWMVAIIACGGIFQAFDTIDFWFQSQVLSKYTVVAKSMAFLSVSILKVGLILAKAPVIAFAMAGTLEIALGSAFLVIAYRKNGFQVREWRVETQTAFSMLKDSWPLLFSGIFVMLYIRIDQVMIGEMLGSSEVGVYSAAVSLTEVWYFIPMAITSSVLPAIIDAKKKDEVLYYDRLKKLFLVMFWLSVAGPILISLFSREIVRLVFLAAPDQLHRRVGECLGDLDRLVDIVLRAATPAEALEHAYPLRLRQYSFRPESGGRGLHAGGDGIVREIEVLTDAQVTLLADRRSRGPYGLGGASNGAPGRTIILRRDGTQEELAGKTSVRLCSGERVRVETPGGGGWGKPK